jgi:hybrid cluster-associated redox disulfide protein|tara:strand:- start:6616 stop:6852 length:237 start_codon:yes stop_codon:yes gene_type:complete
MEQKQAQKITKDTTIGEIVEKYPQVVETLTDFGLHCVGCHVSAYESLEAGFRGHGMDDKTIDEALKRLNEVVEKSNSK